jgi:ATP-dependent helicase YprA (DUF1998 family)
MVGARAGNAVVTASHPDARTDFLALSRALEDTYRSYLRATFHFRDPALRQSFDHALRDDRLAQGPYVEAIPPFEKHDTLDAVARARASLDLDERTVRALRGDRALYAHQAEAIARIASGRNVVVATGTGSGKTEAFLYPILLHLYRESLRGQRAAGIRALVLYPMNALANDQRDRLREIDRALVDANAPFRFTFGQYIGETPHDDRDSMAATTKKNASPNELVLRTEMQRAPPDILLTNYSMLEYLLLRPADSQLFDNGNGRWWSFIVLDEAHQYRGAKGIEMAMLLRRLKERIRAGGRQGEIRCIATSATLGGPDERARIAAFAADLFGEPFDEDDVIQPIVRNASWNGSRRLDPDDYLRLEEAYDRQELRAAQLGQILMDDERAARLANDIRAAPCTLEQLASTHVPELALAEAAAVVSRLLRLLTAAIDGSCDRLKGPSSPRTPRRASYSTAAADRPQPSKWRFAANAVSTTSPAGASPAS